MSRFGPLPGKNAQKDKVQIALSNNEKRSPSPQKKKPFISTTKSLDIFGEPPPFRSRSLSPEPRIVEDVQPLSFPIEPDFIGHTHIVAFHNQTYRWCNLSSTFWSLVILDSQRSVDKTGILNFFEVIQWRTNGKISEEEFTVLFSEWLGKANGVSGQKKRSILGQYAFRQMLLEKSCSENDLDLYIGLCIHENNKIVAGSPISFANSIGGSSFQICSSEWINLIEELFFLLDTTGYGLLRYDELVALGACLTIGVRGWSDVSDVEKDLSIDSIAAVTLRMMIEMGSNPIIRHLGNISSSGNQVSCSSDNFWCNRKSFVTLPMFKSYFLRKSILASMIREIITNLQSFFDYMSRTTRDLAPDIYSSFFTLDSQASFLGPPRLWQRAVITAIAGQEIDRSSYYPASLPSSSILNYLLSDADCYLSGLFRSSECIVSDFQNSLNNATTHYSGYSNIEASIQQNFQNEVSEVVLKLWKGFHQWDISYEQSKDSLFRRESRDDPIYQLFYSIVMEYKVLQHRLSAAFIDMTLQFYFIKNCDEACTAFSKICASLLPSQVDAMMEELSNFATHSSSSHIPSLNKIVSARTSPQSSNFTLSNAVSHSGSQNFSSRNTSISASTLTPTTNHYSSPILLNSSQEMTPNSTVFSSPSSASLLSNSNHLRPSHDVNNGNNNGFNSNSATGRSTISKSATSNNNSNNNSNSNNSNNNNENVDSSNSNVGVRNNNHRGSFSRWNKESILVHEEPKNDSYQSTVLVSTIGNTTSMTSMTTMNNMESNAKSSSSSNMNGRNQPPPSANEVQWNSIFDYRNVSPSGMKSLSKLRKATTATKIDVSTETLEEEFLHGDRRYSESSTSTLGSLANHLPMEEESKLIDELVGCQDSQRQQKIIDRIKEIRQRRHSLSASTSPSQKELAKDSKFKNSSRENHHNGFVPTSLKKPDLSVETSMATRNDAELEVPSSPAPSSIAELLSQGQDAGKYAHSLRQILRKMSRNNNVVHLESLEKVLELGNQLVENAGPSVQESLLNKGRSNRSPSKLISGSRNQGSNGGGVGRSQSGKRHGNGVEKSYLKDSDFQIEVDDESPSRILRSKSQVDTHLSTVQSRFHVTNDTYNGRSSSPSHLREDRHAGVQGSRNRINSQSREREPFMEDIPPRDSRKRENMPKKNSVELESGNKKMGGLSSAPVTSPIIPERSKASFFSSAMSSMFSGSSSSSSPPPPSSSSEPTTTSAPVISRVSANKIPGQLPSGNMSKQPKKAFGHLL